MKILAILAASLAIGVAAPAFASDGAPTEPTGQIEFLQNTAKGTLIEGRNSARIETVRSNAATSQNFFPVNTVVEGTSR
jgi:hypothetical protein